MDRRRLLIGLGAITVGSATASLTGATLTESVSPTANFQFNVEPNFIVRAAHTSDTLQDPAGNDISGSFPDSAGTTGRYTLDPDLSGDTTDGAFGESGPFVVANDRINNEFPLALSVPLEERTFTFEKIMLIQNGGGFSATSDRIAFQYVSDIEADDPAANGFGSDVTDHDVAPTNADFSTRTQTTLSGNGVAELFKFTGTNSSESNLMDPPGKYNTPQQPEDDVLVNPEGNPPDSILVDLTVDLTATGQFSNFADATSETFSDGTAAAALETIAKNTSGDLLTTGGYLDLVDTIFVGVAQ